MNKKIKIGIVIGLFFMIAAVLAYKQSQNHTPRGTESAENLRIFDERMKTVSQIYNEETTSTQEISKEKTDNAANLPKLVDLGSDKCVPCKLMAPILAELKKEYDGRFDVVFIDVAKNPGAEKSFNIRLIPTQIFLAADGKELFRHEGFFAKEEILKKWEELGIKFEENK